jgi:hypothetical protein
MEIQKEKWQLQVGLRNVRCMVLVIISGLWAGCQRFTGACCLHLHSRFSCFTFNMKAAGFSEILFPSTKIHGVISQNCNLAYLMCLHYTLHNYNQKLYTVHLQVTDRFVYQWSLIIQILSCISVQRCLGQKLRGLCVEPID